MSYDEFKTKLKSLGYSLRDFAKYANMHETTVLKWKNNEVPSLAIKVIELLEKNIELENKLSYCEDKIKKMCKDID